MGRYVADFARYSAKLVVELDGSQHADSARDLVRDDELRRRGFRVLRFWNSDFVTNHRGVLDTIYAAVEVQQP